ncbi:hypothetical protein [Hoylesella saccharolytica]|uniref:hypothetical protein n=1 Tax=Hoylesella saccharolytica TaxID=633701 RepID=UPI000470AA9C|nr:hypothetical protein [Hoylesella saccharolytica]
MQRYGKICKLYKGWNIYFIRGGEKLLIGQFCGFLLHKGIAMGIVIFSFYVTMGLLLSAKRFTVILTKTSIRMLKDML